MLTAPEHLGQACPGQARRRLPGAKQAAHAASAAAALAQRRCLSATGLCQGVRATAATALLLEGIHCTQQLPYGV